MGLKARPKRTAGVVNPAHAELRSFALSLPETVEHLPWGHPAIKVRKKAFVFMNNDEPKLSLSVKLASSQNMALLFPFATPTGYGLGKSGWVSSSFEPGEDIPVPLLKEWIEESYRSIAPKTLVKLLP